MILVMKLFAVAPAAISFSQWQQNANAGYFALFFLVFAAFATEK